MYNLNLSVVFIPPCSLCPRGFDFSLCALRVFVVALCLFLAACSSPDFSPAPIKHEGIVSLAPHLTECLFALGQGSRVRAIGEFDDYPPESQSLPRVGGYVNPDLEKITALAPALIIVPGKHPKVSEYAALNQIPLLNVQMDSFATIDSGLAQLGEALDCPDAARRLQVQLAQERSALEKEGQDTLRPKTLIITYRHSHDLNTLYTVGGTSFVSELVHLVGGENIFAGENSPYFEASKESILTLAPEHILEFHCGENLNADQIAYFKKDWQAMPGLPAVAKGNIHIITESHALRPGPRIMQIARLLAGILHPEKVTAQ